jgi:hypothetical protein
MVRLHCPFRAGRSAQRFDPGGKAKMKVRFPRKPAKPEPPKSAVEKDGGMRKNWENACDNCDGLPTVGDSGLCGPCFFGEAKTAEGEW